MILTLTPGAKAPINTASADDKSCPRLQVSASIFWGEYEEIFGRYWDQSKNY